MYFVDTLPTTLFYAAVRDLNFPFILLYTPLNSCSKQMVGDIKKKENKGKKLSILMCILAVYGKRSRYHQHKGLGVTELWVGYKRFITHVLRIYRGVQLEDKAGDREEE